jgi:DNA-directed RNA polymerase specialized sigma24 family protein
LNQPDDHPPTPLDDQKRIIVNNLSQLPPEQQQILALVYFRGYSNAQAAEILHQPIDDVQNSLRLALQSLRKAALENALPA